jgi:hypothetical protein
MRTLEEALDYLDYHSPNDETIPKHDAVNEAFQELMGALWDHLPDGPGKTVAVRAIGAARMQCNSCIANKGN